MYSAGRYREEQGKFVLTPWLVHVWGYTERGGMRIPLEGEVAWQLPGRDVPYWKGKIVDVQHGFVK